MKHLKDFSDDELFEYLENNEKTPLIDLAGICSEVLRRMIKKEREDKLKQET